MKVEDTVAERSARYGAFSAESIIAMRIKNILREQPGWNKLSPSQQHGLDNIVQKITRVINGDPNHIDNWHDISGYATLIEKELQNEKNQTFTTLGNSSLLSSVS